MDPHPSASSPAPPQARTAPHEPPADAPTTRPSSTTGHDSLPAHAAVPGPAQTAPAPAPFPSSRGQRRILQPQNSHVSNSMLGPHPPSPFVSVQSSTPPASCYSPWPISLPSEQPSLDSATSPGYLAPVQAAHSSRLAAAPRGSYPGSQSYGSSYIGCIEEEEAEEEGAARYRQLGNHQQQGREQVEQAARRRHLARVSVDAAVAAEVLPDGHSGGLSTEYGSNSLLTAVPEWQESAWGAGARSGRGSNRGSNSGNNAGHDVLGGRQGAADGMRMHRASMHGAAMQRQRASASFTGGGVSGGRDSSSGDGGGGGGPAGSLRHAMHRWSDSGTAAFGWLGRLVNRISVRVSNGSSSRGSSNAGGPSGDGRSPFRSAGARQPQPSDDGRGGIASPTTPVPPAPGSGWRRALWSPLVRAVSGEVSGPGALGHSPQPPTSPEGWVRGASNTSTSTASVASGGSERDQVRFLRHMDSKLVHRRQFAQGGGPARPAGAATGGEPQPLPRLQQLPPKPQTRLQEQGTLQQQQQQQLHHQEPHKQRGWDQSGPPMPGATGSPAPPASPRIRAGFPSRTYTVRPQPPPAHQPPQQVASSKSLPNLHDNDSFRGSPAGGCAQGASLVRSGRACAAPRGTPLAAPASATVHEQKVQFARALLPGVGSSHVYYPAGHSKSARGMEITESGSRGRGMLGGEWSERFVGGGGGGGGLLAGGGVLPVLSAGDLEDDTYEELIGSALQHRQQLYGEEE